MLNNHSKGITGTGVLLVYGSCGEHCQPKFTKHYFFGFL